MTKIGTTFTKSGKKAVLCGSGELGKEVAIELQRYGVQVVALDKYANAPAMLASHMKSYVKIYRTYHAACFCKFCKFLGFLIFKAKRFFTKYIFLMGKKRFYHLIMKIWRST